VGRTIAVGLLNEQAIGGQLHDMRVLDGPAHGFCSTGMRCPPIRTRWSGRPTRPSRSERSVGEPTWLSSAARTAEGCLHQSRRCVGGHQADVQAWAVEAGEGQTAERAARGVLDCAGDHVAGWGPNLRRCSHSDALWGAPVNAAPL
jgi:hypothetical protein